MPLTKVAARAGARVGLLVGGLSGGVMLVARLLPSDFAAPHGTRPWLQLVRVAVLSVVTCVVSGVWFATVAAALVRWGRRLAVWIRFRY